MIRRNNTVVCRFLFPLVSSFIPIILMLSNAHASDAKKGAALAQGLCAACHASDGNSVIPTNPILAGQHYSYLKNQLNYFQVKEGEDKAKRENAVMLGIASGLSSDDIDNLSAYYSQQKIKPSYASNIELAKAGEVVYKAGDDSRGIPSCSSCHGPRGLGVPGQFPRISGQHAAYTASTLTSYKNGSRANNKQMMAISSRLTEEQINALAEYLAGLE
ncbi:MAG: cytochrome c [Burkholderiaceae bacterium]|nr:MAG: cytochrome c [Burkholderiaceae bacterium]